MKKKNFSLIVLAALFILNIFAWIAVFDLKENKFLKVIFFDVGQGDASFIETPQRHQILIDGGPSSVILEKLGENLPFWDRTIDLVILTHPESDHLTGLLEVLKKYKVENILWTGIVRDTPEYKEWLNLIEKEGAKIKIAQAGQKIIASEATFYILNPSENLEGKIIKDSNDTSIVSKLVFGKNSFLFTGDIYNSVEKEFVSGGIDLKSDILKVAHHGSKTSTSQEFLERVLPEIAVISVAKDNAYGHPYQEVLERLEKYAKIFRTDRNGDIKIFSDGNSLKIFNVQ
jgi:competence protein ComEC